MFFGREAVARPGGHVIFAAKTGFAGSTGEPSSVERPAFLFTFRCQAVRSRAAVVIPVNFFILFFASPKNSLVMPCFM